MVAHVVILGVAKLYSLLQPRLKLTSEQNSNWHIVWMIAFVKEKPWSWQWTQHNAFAYCDSPFLQHPNFYVGDTVDARGTLEVATFMSIWMEQHGQLKASHELMTSILELFIRVFARRSISTKWRQTSEVGRILGVGMMFVMFVTFVWFQGCQTRSLFWFWLFRFFFFPWVWYTLTSFSYLVKQMFGGLTCVV